MNNKLFSFRKFGFTLAEVLITLGIIGVVAAITLSTLISNYQKHQYVNQLKKSYSEISNVFKLMLAQDEVEYLDETEFFKGFPGETQNFNGVPEYLDTALKKHFKVLKTCHQNDSTCNPIEYLTLEKSPSPITTKTYNFYTANGQIIYLAEFRKQLLPDPYNDEAKRIGCPGIIGRISIDINGEKKPNQYGRDYFSYRLCSNGKLLAQGSKELAIAADNMGYWWKTGYNCKSNGKGVGHGCAGRVMENGWKMDY